MNQRQPRRSKILCPGDITGERFGSMVVICLSPEKSKIRKRPYWKVRCDCGKEIEKRWPSIRDGIRCGWCKPIKHGHARRGNFSPEYSSWAAMVQRCTNPANQDFKDYLGRGITVCQRWRDNYEDFFADMGSKPTRKHEIERVDNNLGYYAENCIWATRQQQTRNKRNTLYVTWNGKLTPLIKVCEEAGFSYTAIKQRINKLGWDEELALSTPVLKYGQRKPK